MLKMCYEMFPRDLAFFMKKEGRWDDWFDWIELNDSDFFRKERLEKTQSPVKKAVKNNAIEDGLESLSIAPTLKQKQKTELKLTEPVLSFLSVTKQNSFFFI